MIRPLADADWDDIVALEADAYEASGLSEDRAALRSRAWPGTCFVAETEQRVAGYVLALPYPMFQYPDLARPEEPTCQSSNLHLHDLVVAKRFRGRGLGRQLLGHLTAAATALRYERICLVAVEGSDTFWSANGYHAHPDVVLPNSYGARAVYMSRTT